MYYVLILYGIVIFIIPILIFYLRLKFMKWLGDSKRKQDKIYKKHFEKEYEKIYQREYKPFYEATVRLFKNKMKGSELDRKHILEFKELVNKSLGSYLSGYNTWHFRNDAMEIYCKLKSHHIDKNDFENLIFYLERIH
jgi:hypothetical protein